MPKLRKEVDNDAQRYTEDELRNWKISAENCTSQQLRSRSPFDKTGAPEIDVSAKIGTMPKIEFADLNFEGILQHALTLAPPKEAENAQNDQTRNAKILTSGRGLRGQPYAVVGISSNYDWDWTVVLFVAGEFGWDLLARINLGGQKGYVPDVIYIPGTPGALAVTHVNGYGTGLFQRSTTWYRIAKGTPGPLLSYPNVFYVYGWENFDRHLPSKVLQMPNSITDGAVLNLQFDVTYEIGQRVSDGKGGTLFSVTETLSLEWNESAATFVPRTPTDDFTRVEKLWSEGTEGFVNRNQHHLRELLRSGTEEQMRFIREHLSPNLT